MEWIAIVQLLLPVLLKILEDSPQDEAVRHMKRRGLFFRLRVANALRSEMIPKVIETLESQLAGMSDEDLVELCQQARAAKAAREGT